MTCINVSLGDDIDLFGRRARCTSFSTCMAPGRSQSHFQSRRSRLLGRFVLFHNARHRADLWVADSVWVGSTSEEPTISQSTLAPLRP